MYDAYSQNIVDVDGWQKAGAVIAWILNSQVVGQPFKPEQWPAFMPRPGHEEEPQTSESMEQLVRANYG